MKRLMIVILLTGIVLEAPSAWSEESMFIYTQKPAARECLPGSKWDTVVVQENGVQGLNVCICSDDGSEYFCDFIASHPQRATTNGSMGAGPNIKTQPEGGTPNTSNGMDNLGGKSNRPEPATKAGK